MERAVIPARASLEVTDAPDPSVRTAVSERLLAYNAALLGPPGTRPLAILLRAEDGSDVVGGLWGRTSYGWLFVELLFVPEGLRGQGVGAALLQAAETEAGLRSCRGIWLDTFSAAAATFYRKQGFRPFGVIPDYPPGAARQFLFKRL